MSKVFISCALPYANGPCHLGHIRSTYLPADIFARYHRMIGDDVLLVCATDEHGTPIAVKADKENKKPIEISSSTIALGYKIYSRIQDITGCGYIKLVGDLVLIPGLGRPPGEGKGYLLEHYGLQNSMDRGAWQATVHGVTNSRT